VPTIFLKPESVNTKTKARARQPDAMMSIGERHEQKKFVLPFFQPNEMPALFPVQRNIGTRLKVFESMSAEPVKQPRHPLVGARVYCSPPPPSAL
jgi:hypothetical protein